jgi:hypothetical protein
MQRRPWASQITCGASHAAKHEIGWIAPLGGEEQLHQTMKGQQTEESEISNRAVPGCDLFALWKWLLTKRKANNNE